MKISSLFKTFICLALFSFGSMYGYSQIPTLNPIRLTYDPMGKHDNHRAPAKAPLLPVVAYDAAEGVLLFESEESIDSLPVTIVDENGNIAILQTISIQADSPAAINISSLTDGLYYIKLSVAGRTYIGEFEIGE